ncbi:DUF4870 domain-containing protein [Paenarthrobacter sp. Z7-10]|uniref:DUF4870 domain-containing protein n=1 Tax=Paenarthrobacter sp. Z7-10 TaxID=2787635 RepID=UPI0022A9E0B0|nr:DUF4870 domain-containing protein [Paenarthrobacter sp. Z7-10]MCZ2402692.1 DUF4870 domain-containing protein [Paenarthrobacter sp. Z7-10]
MVNSARGNDADRAQEPREPVQYQGVPANAPPLTASEDRQWAFMAHCGGILGFVPALVIYIVFRDRGPFTAQESKEALNFTLPPTILAALANILALAVPSEGSLFAILAVALWIFLTVYSVVAAIAVNRGRPYRYLLNLRLIR